VTRNRDYRDEISFFGATQRLDPGVPRNRMNLALALRRAGDSGGAQSHLRAATALWPGYTQARLLEAHLLQDAQRPAEALAVLRDGAPWAEGRAEFHYRVGLACDALKRPQEALRAYETASRLDPGFWPADLKAGVLSMRLGRSRAARAHLEKALRAARWRLPEGIYYLALAYRNLGMSRDEQRVRAVLRRAAPELAEAYRRGEPP
jgi:tetratricopeptide (TPR) repeat protein